MKNSKVVKTTPAEKEMIEKSEEAEELNNNETEKNVTKPEVSNKKLTKAEKKVQTAKENADKKANKNADDANKKRWFKSFKGELKKIVWPTGKELFDNTAVVIAMVIIVSLLIFVLDLALESLTGLEAKQLNSVKSQISASNTENTASNDTNSTEANAVELINSTDVETNSAN